MSDERPEEPTDVLVAEEFAVPAPDPALHHEELVLPSDLAGGEPRDVLVAEEFAMPAPDEARVRRPDGAHRRQPLAAVAAANLTALLGGIWMWRRLRRHRAVR